MLYISGKGRIGKSKVVHTIKLGCALSSQNLDLIITAPTDAVADNIGGSTIHTSLAIIVRNRYGKSNTISNLWTAQYIIIIDKIGIIKPEMLFNMEKQLAKARGLSNSSITVFEGLLNVIIMENFYQFLFIAVCLLWGKLQTDRNHNDKI